MISVCQHLGIMCWRNNSQGTYDPRAKKYRQLVGHTRKGVADIIGVLPGGRALFIEAKTKTGKLSSEQVDFLQQAKSMGALAFEANDLKSMLENFTSIPGLNKEEIQRLLEKV